MSEQEQEWAQDKGRSLKSNPIRPDENVELAMNDIGRNGWHLDGTEAVFSLDDIDESLPQYSNRIFTKKKLLKDMTLNQRKNSMIASLSPILLNTRDLCSIKEKTSSIEP